MNLSEYIEHVLRDMRKPRQICICGDFAAGRHDIEYDFVKCRNCGGWMSALRIVEHEVYEEIY